MIKFNDQITIIVEWITEQTKGKHHYARQEMLEYFYHGRGGLYARYTDRDTYQPLTYQEIDELKISLLRHLSKRHNFWDRRERRRIIQSRDADNYTAILYYVAEFGRLPELPERGREYSLKVLEFINSYIAKNDKPPLQREIVQGTHLHRSAVTRALVNFKRNMFIEIRQGKHRNIEVVDRDRLEQWATLVHEDEKESRAEQARPKSEQNVYYGLGGDYTV